MAETASANRDHRARQMLDAFTNTNLHLIILPTEQCNFRCVYCYEDFSVGTMSPPVVAGVKRLLAERVPDLRNLHIAWFGGEPLLALGVIREISARATELAGACGTGYRGEMTTNGYRLDARTARELHDLGIRHYQVTLDGPPAYHDRTRVRRDGGGSFERIWGNLVALRDSDLPISLNLRIHVNPTNLAVMPGFLAEVKREFLGDRRFTIMLKPVGRWGGPNDDTLAVLEGDDRRTVAPRLTAQVLEDLSEDAEFHPDDVCYASRPNSFVIRASGEVGKCTVALADPANTIGRLREDGSLEVKNDALQPWLRGWSTDPDALGCPLIGLPRGAGEPVLLQIGARPGTRRADARDGV